MGDDTMVSDYPDTDQRIAICYGSWDDLKGNSSKTNKLVTRNRMATLEADASLVRNETLDGRTYVVAPVVAIREGVHNGEFISFEELSVFPEVWSGKPLPIDHPKDAEGLPMTANRKDVIESSVVGSFLNVVADTATLSLRGELWIDTGKAATIPGGQESVDRVVNGEQLEVSTAYFTYLDNVSGEWVSPAGEVLKYSSSQYRIGPDHLALLPFDNGACSWEDGCGAPRVNQRKEVNPQTSQTPDLDVGYEDMADKNLKVNGKQLGSALKAALKAHGDGTQMSDRLAVAAGISSEQFAQLANGDVDFAPRYWLNTFAAVLDVDPWDLMMAASNDNSDVRYNGSAGDGKAAKPCGCQTTENEDAVAITQNVADAPKFRAAVLKVLSTMGITQTDSEDNSMTTKERVDALIASEKTAFTEDNREVLMSMNEDQLAIAELSAPAKEEKAAVVEKAAPKAEAAAANAQKSEVQTVSGLTKEDVANVVNTALADALKSQGLTPETIAALNAGNAKARATRDARIEKLASNEDCLLSKEELAGLSDETLDKVENQLADSKADFWRAAPAGNTRDENDQNTVPEPPAILLGKPATNSRIAQKLGLVASQDGGN